MAARILAVTQRKGGVAKTTTATNLAYELAKKGQRVLFVDLDSQANSTPFFIKDDTEFYIGDALLNHRFDIKEAIYPAIIKGEEVPNLSVIPARGLDEMTNLDMQMISLQRREERLADQLEKVSDDYDFVIIDTAPTANIVLMNASFAANEFIFPVDGSAQAYDGVETMLQHILEVQYKRYTSEGDIDFLVVPVRILRSMSTVITDLKDYCAERFPYNTAKTKIWERRAAFLSAEKKNLPLSVDNKSSEESMYYKRLADEVLANVI